MGVKFGLVSVDGLFLYCFFDYSVGKFVVVVLLNKRKCYFFLDEFLSVWGSISGSKVSLFMSPRFGVMLYSRFGVWDFKVKLFENFIRYFVNLVFVSSVFCMDVNYKMWFSSGSYLGSFSLIEGLEFFVGFYSVFCENLCMVLCREFGFFLFYFFFLFFFDQLLWWFIIVFFFFKYFNLFFSVMLFSYFVSFLKGGVLVNKFNWLLSSFKMERSVVMQGTGVLFSLVNLCFYLKQSVLGFDLLKFKESGYDVFFFFKCFMFGLKKILGIFSFSHLWKFFKLLEGFFGLVGDYKSWGSAFLMLFDRFYSKSGIGFGLDGWYSLLSNFSYYYYLERDIVFSFWSVPSFRSFWSNFYWWWFRYLNIQSVGRSFFSFGLESVIGFRSVGSDLTKFWFICLYSMYFVLLVLFFMFFFDYSISSSWVIFLFCFFKLFLVNVQYFFRSFFSGSVWVSGYSELYFKVWLLLVESVFNSIKKYELVYSFLAFFLLFFFKFPSLSYKNVSDLFKCLRLSELYFLFWYNLKYMMLYIWSWMLVIYSAFFTNLGLLYYSVFSVSFLGNNEVGGQDSYLVGALEVWESWKWFDMFSGNSHDIFSSFLGKNVKSLTDLNSVSSLGEVFWKRFIKSFGSVFGKEDLNLGLFYSKNLVNWGSQFISFTLSRKSLGKVFGSGRSRLDYFWNYENLISELQKLKKVWPGLWFKLVKSYVYGVRMADILSVVNFGSEIYSEQLFKLVYRYMKPEVKVPQFYDPVFDMYSDWESRRSDQLGSLVIGWLRRSKMQQRIFDVQSSLLKSSNVGLGWYWYDIIFDSLLFQTKYCNLLRRIVKLPFYFENWKNINMNSCFFLFSDLNLQMIWDLLKIYHQVKDFGIDWLNRPMLKENMKLKVFSLRKVLSKVAWQNSWKNFLKVGKTRYDLSSMKWSFDGLKSEDKYSLVKAGLGRDFDAVLWRKGVIWKVGRSSLSDSSSFSYYNWKFSGENNWGLESMFKDGIDKKFSRGFGNQFRSNVGKEFGTKFNKKLSGCSVTRKFTDSFAKKFVSGEGKNSLTSIGLKRFK